MWISPHVTLHSACYSSFPTRLLQALSCLFRNWWIPGEDSKRTDGEDAHMHETKDILDDIASSRNSAVYSTCIFPPCFFPFLGFLFLSGLSSFPLNVPSVPNYLPSLPLTYLAHITLFHSPGSTDAEPPPALWSVSHWPTDPFPAQHSRKQGSPP